MNLINVHKRKLDMYFLAYKFRSNVASGVSYDYGIEDLIYAYEISDNLANIQDWLEETKLSVIKMVLENKTRNAIALAKKGQLSDDIEEKRMCLIEAIRLEREVLELING